MIDFETTKKIIQNKMGNVQVVDNFQSSTLNKSFMMSDHKNELNSSPSIEELRKKFLEENKENNFSDAADAANPEQDDIGVIKVRNKDQGADSPHTSGDRTIIVKKGGIYGAQG